MVNEDVFALGLFASGVYQEAFDAFVTVERTAQKSQHGFFAVGTETLFFLG